MLLWRLYLTSVLLSRRVYIRFIFIGGDFNDDTRLSFLSELPTVNIQLWVEHGPHMYMSRFF